MSVGLDHPQELHPIAGVRIGAADAGIRKSKGPDIALFEISSESAIAATFTKNRARAAPVEVALRRISEERMRSDGQVRALVVNSGNANAGMGQRGIRDCETVCELVGESLGINPRSVLPFSTGVIGEPLPVSCFEQHLKSCSQARSEDGWLHAAEAIMTTDTIPKAVSKQVQIETQGHITITGIAKGSGMIQPNMATMLAFVATDAAVEADYLQQALENVVNDSFNCISVDGDTSTNDSCVLIATGASGIQIGHDASNEVNCMFNEALRGIMQMLAQSIVRDGEGITKFVTIRVDGGSSQSDCAKVAMTVANSPLVKTALHASDPNWGRIYAAIGRSPVEVLDMSAVGIHVDDVEIVRNGERTPHYSEKEAMDVMQNSEFSIRIDLGINPVTSATVWTTDLSYEYIRINAEYRT